MRAEAQPTEIDSQIDSQADLGPIKEASAIPLKRPSKTLSGWFSDKTLTKRASLNGLAALLDCWLALSSSLSWLPDWDLISTGYGKSWIV